MRTNPGFRRTTCGGDGKGEEKNKACAPLDMDPCLECLILIRTVLGQYHARVLRLLDIAAQTPLREPWDEIFAFECTHDDTRNNAVGAYRAICANYLGLADVLQGHLDKAEDRPLLASHAQILLTNVSVLLTCTSTYAALLEKILSYTSPADSHTYDALCQPRRDGAPRAHDARALRASSRAARTSTRARSARSFSTAYSRSLWRPGQRRGVAEHATRLLLPLRDDVAARRALGGYDAGHGGGAVAGRVPLPRGTWALRCSAAARRRSTSCTRSGRRASGSSATRIPTPSSSSGWTSTAGRACWNRTRRVRSSGINDARRSRSSLSVSRVRRRALAAELPTSSASSPVRLLLLLIPLPELALRFYTPSLPLGGECGTHHHDNGFVECGWGVRRTAYRAYEARRCSTLNFRVTWRLTSLDGHTPAFSRLNWPCFRATPANEKAKAAPPGAHASGLGYRPSWSCLVALSSLSFAFYDTGF
ncbi:hypothetical protein B0H11DRAFT_2225121 [Mycena galericulata]|nr:hypothetical protein B0H11DRAFT_2225121 [Mycena galericulata]